MFFTQNYFVNDIRQTKMFIQKTSAMNIHNACYPSITDSVFNIFICVDDELYDRTLHKSLFNYLH